MTSPSTPKPQQIGLGLAVAVGLASMLGAGVFVVFHEADALTSKVSGRWALLIAIALAGLVATLNAASVYQLAKVVSRAGGVYAYSRVYVGPNTSFIAGFSFIFGKIGSIAAIGLVFGLYVWPAQPVLAAVLAIAGLAALNLLGINRTAKVALGLAISTVGFLLVTIVWGYAHGVEAVHASGTAVTPPGTVAAGAPHVHTLNSVVNFISAGNISPILSAAALIFFAFAGYARVATLGDEVRNPTRNIPRAIAIALSAVLVLYFALAIMLQNTLGSLLAQSSAPLVTFWQNSTISFSWPPSVIETIVMIFAAAASLGSMLALLAGVSRTAATMAEDRELPSWFSARNRNGAPWLAEVLIALGAIVLVQFGRLDWVIGFSSLSVLLYYAIGHFSALRQLAGQAGQDGTAPSRAAHITRAATAWAGMLLCAVLLLSVPGPAVWLSAIVLVAALFVRRIARARD
jgi:APA family basic amino acid/polyamine antiporter